MKIRRSGGVFMVLGLGVVAVVFYCLLRNACPLLTPDQRAHRLFAAGDFAAAAETFRDPLWQGVSLFRQGEFEQAAGVFSGFDTAESAFNQSNALVLMGRYHEAVARYDRALELEAGWESARVNRDIAAARAALLDTEGGEMTGGRLEPDEIVFSDKKKSSSTEEQTEGGDQMSDEELRSIWLRQVQTKPADFLRAKFAYQFATQADNGGGGE